MEKNPENKELFNIAYDRNKTIIVTSIIGIIANLFLAGFKAAVGMIANSIAVILDAVNNLTDALSSVITIVGTLLSNKAPDKKHPLGYGRIEYLSAMLVAGLVLYAGITALVESIKKIVHPEAADYSTVSLIIIAVAIVVKLVLGWFVKRQGKKVNSGALVASGSDASFDAVLSASVLASALIYLKWHVSLEAYVGVIIAAFIIKAGVEMMLETLNDILGHRQDAELTKKIKDTAKAQPEVLGAYDVFVFNYGPNKNYGTVHLELPDTMTAEEIDRLSRRIQLKVYEETDVILTGVSTYSQNTQTPEVIAIREKVYETLLAHDWVLEIHGFYVDLEKKTMRMDAVTDFGISRLKAEKELHEELKAIYPDYEISVVPDIDISD